MTNTLGIDIGSLNFKIVLLGENGILAESIVPTGEEAERTVRSAVEQLLSRSGLNLDSMPVVATGIGAKTAMSASQRKSITTCLARGISHLFPAARLVIDMGAESTTVLKVNQRGKLADWVDQDKCASGTGLFLQQMAKLMQLTPQEMATLSAGAKNKPEITSTCAVFAESEVISHVHRIPPTPRDELAAGIFLSVVRRTVSLCKRIGIEKEVAVTGGVALNGGLVKILEEELGFKVLVPEKPQIVAALGAAVIARESVEKGAAR